MIFPHENRVPQITGSSEFIDTAIFPRGVVFTRVFELSWLFRLGAIIYADVFAQRGYIARGAALFILRLGDQGIGVTLRKKGRFVPDTAIFHSNKMGASEVGGIWEI